MKKLLLPILAALALPYSVNANSMVKDALNNADQQFKLGMDGCIMVTLAIQAANWPEAYGEVSYSLREEVKRYAQRCNLRF
mgnify:CR=1 FL=1